MADRNKNIVLGVTGSIAAYKSVEIVRSLQDQKCIVSVVMTAAATRFITPLTMAGISRRQVYTDMFDAGHKNGDKDHVGLAEWADAVLVAPATADFIGKAACGIADDLLTCTVMATRSPVLIAPAMNEGMYRNPVVQENIQRLKKIGFVFIGPAKGRLACGTSGEGRLAAIDEIVKQVKKAI